MNTRTYTYILIFLVLAGCRSKLSQEDKKAKEIVKKERVLAKKKADFDRLKVEIKKRSKELAQLKGKTVQKKRKLVSLLAVEQEDFAHYVEVQGVAESNQDVSVTTDIGGVVKRVFVRQGEYVRQGQRLAQLDDNLVSKQLEELNTSLELAHALYEKQKRLWEKGVGAEVQYLQAKNNKEALEQKKQTILAQQEKFFIVAPISGRIDDVFVKVGELAKPGYPAFKVVRLDDIEVKAQVPERYIRYIKRGGLAKVFFPAIDETRQTRIQSVSQVINPNDRTFTISMKIGNKKGTVKPNLLATVLLNDYTNKNTLIVPTRLIQQYRNQDFVFVASPSSDSTDTSFVVDRRFVQVGVSYKGKSEIIKGLSAGDLLVDEGYRNILSGEEVVRSTERY